MRSIVISPHPDDEVLGAGGTLFKRNTIKKNSLYWIIVTRLHPSTPKKKIVRRNYEIKKISAIFKFKKVFQLNFNTTELDNSSKKKLILNFSDIFNNTLSWSSFLLVGSFISKLKSSLLDINWIIDKESFSISLIELLSSASSYSAKEYLPTDVSEKPLLLLNLYPLLIIEDLLKFEFN